MQHSTKLLPCILVISPGSVFALASFGAPALQASRERAVKAVLEAPGLLVAEQGATEAQLQVC